MKTESPVRAECAMLGMILGIFWPIQAIFVVGGPVCGVCRNPLLSPNNFTHGQLMKTESLVANVTPVGSPD